MSSCTSVSPHSFLWLQQSFTPHSARPAPTTFRFPVVTRIYWIQQASSYTYILNPNHPPRTHFRVLNIVQKSRKRCSCDRNSNLPLHDHSLGHGMGKLGIHRAARARIHGYCRRTGHWSRQWMREGVYCTCRLGECGISWCVSSYQAFQG